MKEPHDHALNSVNSRELEELVERLTQAVAENRSIDLDEICASHPSVADALRDVFPAIVAMGRLAEPDRNESLQRRANEDAALSSRRIGDYRLLHEIGRGGMGVVYEAEQISLSRRVAVKVLPFAAMLNDRQLERFRNEARAAAMLKHPHIVGVHAVGYEQGVHFYVMELVRGQSLADVIGHIARRKEPSEDRPGQQTGELRLEESLQTVSLAKLSTERFGNETEFFRSVAKLGHQAADALHYAHQEGVIHRDIKPSNLLIDRQGKLWITDFGLARTRADDNLTVTNDLLGTLRYMSPEQATGKDFLDERTDVYSLGVTLYELLTGRPAFPQQNSHELLKAVVELRPVAPRKLVSSIPVPLETIVLKAVEQDPDTRYADAAEMRDDLARFLDTKPIRAKRVTQVEHFRWWVKRNPVVAGLAAAVFSLLLLFSILATVTASNAKRAARETRRAARETQRVARETQRVARETADRLYVSDLSRAHQLAQLGEPRLAAALLDRHVPDDGERDRRGFEWAHLRTQCDNVVAEHTLDHDVSVFGAAYSPDGLTFATSSYTSGITMWDAQTQERLFEFEPLNGVTWHVIFTPDGRELLAATTSGEVVALDVNTRARICTFSSPHPTYSANRVAVSPDGKLVAASFSFRRRKYSQKLPAHVVIWDRKSRSQIVRLTDLKGQLDSLAFTLDGRSLASGDGEGVIRIWDTSNWQLASSFQAHDEAVFAMAFSPTDEICVTGSGWRYEEFESGELKIWNTRDWTLEDTLADHDERVKAITFSPDGKLFVSGSADNGISLWDARTRNRRATFRGHAGRIWSIAMSPDSRRLVSTSDDNTAKVWDVSKLLASTGVLSMYRGHAGQVCDLAFADEGRSICSVDANGGVHQWNTQSGALIDQWTVDPSHSWNSWDADIAVSPDNRFMAVASCRGPVETSRGEFWIFDLSSGELKHQGRLPFGFHDGIDFSPKSDLLAVASRDKILVFDVDSHEKVAECETEPGILKCLTFSPFSPDGTQLAASSINGKAYFFDTRNWQQKGPPVQTEELWGALSIDFSPQGDVFATGGRDRRVKLWDARTRKVIRTYAPCPDWIGAVRFSPDGKRILSCGKDARIRIWHRDLDEAVLTIKAEAEWIWNAQFSPDGTMIAAGRDDIHIWRASREYTELVSPK